MNTIELLGEEKTFKDIVEHTITEFEDSEIDTIEGYAFYDCNSVTSVSFPKAKRINQYAFYKCNKLIPFRIANSERHTRPFICVCIFNRCGIFKHTVKCMNTFATKSNPCIVIFIACCVGIFRIKFQARLNQIARFNTGFLCRCI